MSIPANQKLYDNIKTEISKLYKTNSAYRSGTIVKAYKQAGGTYLGAKPKTEGLSKWFKEQWVDVANLNYPVYRPTKRITDETPLTISEIDPKNLKQQIKLKQKIKNKSKLPPFKKK
jgi:hypothetical protein